MLIPLVDLKLQHRQIADELQQGFARLFENTAFILGEEVASFERAFAHFSGDEALRWCRQRHRRD